MWNRYLSPVGGKMVDRKRVEEIFKLLLSGLPLESADRRSNDIERLRGLIVFSI